MNLEKQSTSIWKSLSFLFMALTVLVFSPKAVSADTFGGYQSEHDAMKGYVIVDVGNVTEIAPPPGKQWREDLYQINLRCFVSSGYSNLGLLGYSGKAALLLVNERKDTQIAIFDKDYSNIVVKMSPIQIAECPAELGIPTPCTSEEECLQQMEQLRNRIQKQLEKNRR